MAISYNGHKYSGGGNGASHPYTSLERYRSYSFKITFDKLPERIVGGANGTTGCSSCVYNNKVYRNLDWNYNNGCAFHVITRDFEGMAHSDTLTDGNFNDTALGQLPYQIVDGRNDYGIIITTHVVHNDWEWTGSGNTETGLIPYLILTNVHDINDLSTYVSSIASSLKVPERLANLGFVHQFLISDGTTTYALLPPTTASGNYSLTNISTVPKLANFRWINKTTITSRSDSDLQLHPNGIERWNLMPCEMKDIRYTNVYKTNEWLSEFIGEDNTTKNSTDAELESIYDIAHEAYLDRTRNDDVPTWQTMYSVVYSNKGMEELYFQEDFDRNFVGGGSNSGDMDIALFDKFAQNIDIDYQYDSATNANYTVIRIYKNKFDGTKQFPFVYAPNGAGACEKTSLEIATEDGFFLVSNAGVFNTTTHKADGQLVENGVVLQNSPTATHSQNRPLVIDENGDLSEALYNADANTLVSNGAVSVVCGFMAIIKDFEKVPQSEWNSVSHYTQNAQRQIIGQFGNGDYAIVTCEGRNAENSDGWTIAEAQDICEKLGLKFAYNLDGGGSTETCIGKKMFNHVYEGTSGRNVPTFIVFNGKTTFDVQPTPGEKTLSSIMAVLTGVYTTEDSISDVTSHITTTAHYSNGTSATVTGTYDTSGVTMSTAGTYSIVVSYTEGGITKTTEISLIVTNPIQPSSNVFESGYAINLNSGTQKAHCVNASNRAIVYTDVVNDAPLGNGKYLIPVPSDATSVTVICPNAYSGIAMWGNDMNRLLDKGWSEQIGSDSATFTAGQYAYFSTNFKNASNTNFDVDMTNFSVTFS